MVSQVQHASLAHRHTGVYRLRAFGPGLALCLAVTAMAYALQAGEQVVFGKAWLEALVWAILLGAVLRTLWNPSPRWHAGIAFGAKGLLEISVVLLGASVSVRTLQAINPVLLAGIVSVVALVIPLSFGIGRLIGLPWRMAMLVACGNSICGNSAIAAVAPIINADSEDVAASIAFTAILGVAVVLGLPVAGLMLHMSDAAFGTFAGLTVYAVPQVFAAAAPFGATAVQTGILVKLVRVLMLGPVCVALSLAAPRLTAAEDVITTPKGQQPRLSHLVPWFIVGFLGLAACRSLGFIPETMAGAASNLATFLTVVSMAALGLGVDIRTVMKAGGPVTGAVILSLLTLAAISLMLLHLIGLT
ncbi:YeiH family protein [Acetobacter estunensis]|uniref:YeiH family protein n=1 Tax=Acetobacter estunensis TaxID=104097 RepID=UPI001C2CFE16|nr:putative sulfate exporter family transporter [Acetobacter estunensis]MBV1838329.1 putative sulfate exporter family transporter [Acetobacter estunensis]